MDRRVKERMVGACILVILFILVAPELLSGPKPPSPSAGIKLPASAPRETIRTVNVDLNTNKAASAADGDPGSSGQPTTSPETATPAASPRSDTEPAADERRPTTPDASAPEANPPGSRQPEHDEPEPLVPAPSVPPAAAPGTSKRAVSRPAAAKPVAPQLKPADTHGNWAVQAGTFQNRSNADALVHQLKVQGFAVYVAESTSGKTVYYRVRSTGLGDRAAADRLAGKLKAGGHNASVVSLAH